MNRLSYILGSIPQQSSLKLNYLSKSQKIFTELGLMQIQDGVGTLMPMLMRSLSKVEKIVRKHLREIDALEVKLPILTPSDLLETTGRINSPLLFKVDLHDKKSYVLSPTCEEAAAYMLQGKTIHESNLPLSYYQISTKFRNEMRPKSGLLRTKEFIMKDLYVFDSNEENSEKSYQKIMKLYHRILNVLQVPYMCVEGSTGDIGGLISHEFHFDSKAGEDKLILCQECGHNENLNLSNDSQKCQKCQSTNIWIKNGIEVGHTFKLGTKFTEPLKAYYFDWEKKKHNFHMSSYGLGLTRLLAASVEHKSTENLVWPLAIAPYLVCLVPPKAGSKEDFAVKNYVNALYHELNQILEDDVIVDDRTSLTAGKRLLLLDKIGFPFIVVLGKGVLSDPPTLEVIHEESVDFVQFPDITNYIHERIVKNAAVQQENYGVI